MQSSSRAALAHVFTRDLEFFGISMNQALLRQSAANILLLDGELPSDTAMLATREIGEVIPYLQQLFEVLVLSDEVPDHARLHMASVIGRGYRAVSAMFNRDFPLAATDALEVYKKPEMWADCDFYVTAAFALAAGCRPPRRDDVGLIYDKASPGNPPAWALPMVQKLCTLGLDAGILSKDEILRLSLAADQRATEALHVAALERTDAIVHAVERGAATVWGEACAFASVANVLVRQRQTPRAGARCTIPGLNVHFKVPAPNRAVPKELEVFNGRIPVSR
jgi:hypothetical protein